MNEANTGTSNKKENRIKRIATTTGSFLPLLPFVFFSWMNVFYYWTHTGWPIRGGSRWSYLEVIYIVFIFLIRISLIANLLLLIRQFITSRRTKDTLFSTLPLRIAQFSLCAIATILTFAELGLWRFLFRSLYIMDCWFPSFVIPSITDPRLLFGLLLLLIAVLGCLERYWESKAEITTKIRSIPENLIHIIRKKGTRGGAILKGVSFIYCIIGISFLSWVLISLAVRIRAILIFSREPIIFPGLCFDPDPSWNVVLFSQTTFTILIGAATLFAGIVGFQRKSRRIVLVAWIVYLVIAVVSIPHRLPSVHEFYISVILLALYLLGWLDYRWQPLVGTWAGSGDNQSEYTFYYDGTGSRITTNGSEGFEWIIKSNEGEVLHLTIDNSNGLEGQEVWGFNIEEDVLTLENVADKKMNGTKIEFVRVK